MRRVTITAGVLLLAGLAAGLYLWADDGDAMRSSTKPRRQVSVALLGSADAIAGIDLPPRLAHQRTAYLRANEPSDVILMLPSGTEIQLPVKYVSVTAQYGKVTDVDLLPLDKSVPFKEAVAELHRLLEELKITPDERMKEKMKREWPKDAPGFDPVKRPGFYPHNYRSGDTKGSS